MALDLPSLSYLTKTGLPAPPQTVGPSQAQSLSKIGTNVAKIIKSSRNDKRLEEIKSKPFREWNADDFAFVKKNFPEVIEGQQAVEKRNEVQNREDAINLLASKPVSDLTRRDRVVLSAVIPDQFKTFLDVSKKSADLGPAQRRENSQILETMGAIGTSMFVQMSEAKDPRQRMQIFEQNRQMALRNDPGGMNARMFDEMAKDLGDFSDAGLHKLETESRLAMALSRNIRFGRKGADGAGAGGSVPWGKGGELKWKTKRRAVALGERHVASLIDKYGLPYNPNSLAVSQGIDNDTPVVLTQQYGRVTLREWDEYMQTGQIASKEGDFSSRVQGGGSRKLAPPAAAP